MDHLLEILNQPQHDLDTKAAAASELWNIQNRINNELKRFKKNLKPLARKGEVLHLGNNNYYATVEYQCASPSLESVSIEALKKHLPQDVYDEYVSHSYTIRWGAYRNSPQEVKQLFEEIPNIATKEVVQVKFNNK